MRWQHCGLTAVVAIVLALAVQADQGRGAAHPAEHQVRVAGVRAAAGAAGRDWRTDRRHAHADSRRCTRLGLAGQSLDESGDAASLVQQGQGTAAPGQADHQLHHRDLQPGPLLRSGQTLRLHLVRDAAQHDVVRRSAADAARVPGGGCGADDPYDRTPWSRVFRGRRTSARLASLCRPSTMHWRPAMRRDSLAIRHSAGEAPEADRSARCGPVSTIAPRSTTTCWSRS